MEIMKILTQIIITALFANLLLPGIALASYSDVNGNYEFTEAIDYLELQGAIGGAEDFRPDEPINRAEAFKIIFELMLGEEALDEASSGTYFTDVPEDAWFTPYSTLAKKYELLRGNSFLPNNPLRKFEALDVLLRAYGSGTAITPTSQRTNLFADVSSTHPMYSVVKAASEMEVITANENETLQPYKVLTRGEFADLIYNFDSWSTIQLASELEGSSEFYKSDIFAEIWTDILEDFYLQNGNEIDPEALFQAAVKGMVQSLDDPYSKYFTAENLDGFLVILSGEYEGIGAYLIQDEETGQVFITEFVEGSPAKAVGLKIGDEITAIDDTAITDMTMEAITNRIRGEEGTSVRITILREGQSKTYEVTRQALKVETESAKIIYSDSWYIDINQFASNTAQHLMELILAMQAEVPEPESVIIDLRGNSGGYINAATFVAGLFLPNMTPLLQLDYGSFAETIYNGDTGPYQDLEVFILVDQFTASASEILAATLQENGAATVIGTRTFGKGTAQQMSQYWDGSALKLTIAQWLTGGGMSVQGLGLTPDIEITASTAELEAAKTKNRDLWLEEVREQL